MRVRLAGLTVFFLAGCGGAPEVRTLTFANGQPWSEIHLERGQPAGRWTTWYENGQKKSEGLFERGLRLDHILVSPGLKDAAWRQAGAFASGELTSPARG